MKRVIWAVLAVGLLAVSCGGGNIGKVKNGVFQGFDSTITVGQALANDPILKGGEYKAYKNDGREIVSYTIKFTPRQINDIRNPDSARPNYDIANQIYRLGQSAGYEDWFPLEGDDLKQFKPVFMKAFESILMSAPSLGKATKEDYTAYFDPWLIDHLGDLEVLFNNAGIPRSRTQMINELTLVIERNYETPEPPADFTWSNTWDNYKYGFVNVGINSPELRTALSKSMVKYAEFIKKHEAKEAAWKNQDSEPLVTVNGGSIAFFFIMDQANKDAFNVGGMYLTEDLTLNCFDNKKVIYEFEKTDANFILNYIYKSDSRVSRFL